MVEINRKYKDSVFRMLFNEKDKLIELYNAIFDTDYTEDDRVDITTIEDVIFKTMKNDISFIMDGKFVLLIEHQSSINNNMCLRDLLYADELIRRMIDPKDLYKEAPVKIPNPKFVVLYNGERYMPPFDEQKLSDNFLKEEPEYSLQLKLDVYNINIDAGSELLEKSLTLKQYSMFVERVRAYSREQREQRPYHGKHRIGDTGWIYHGIPHLVGNHIGTCPTQEKGDERTGNGGTKLLTHRT